VLEQLQEAQEQLRAWPQHSRPGCWRMLLLEMATLPHTRQGQCPFSLPRPVLGPRSAEPRAYLQEEVAVRATVPPLTQRKVWPPSPLRATMPLLTQLKVWPPSPLVAPALLQAVPPLAFPQALQLRVLLRPPPKRPSSCARRNLQRLACTGQRLQQASLRSPQALMMLRLTLSMLLTPAQLLLLLVMVRPPLFLTHPRLHCPWLVPPLLAPSLLQLPRLLLLAPFWVALVLDLQALQLHLLLLLLPRRRTKPALLQSWAQQCWQLQHLLQILTKATLLQSWVLQCWQLQHVLQILKQVRHRSPCWKRNCHRRGGSQRSRPRLVCSWRPLGQVWKAQPLQHLRSEPLQQSLQQLRCLPRRLRWHLTCC